MRMRGINDRDAYQQYIEKIRLLEIENYESSKYTHVSNCLHWLPLGILK
jgi:hypothetical protein